MLPLSDYQRDALNSYYQLMADYPNLFAPRSQRPIIQDPEILEAYVAQTGTPIGVTAKTPYVYFVVDLIGDIACPDSGYQPYLRIIPLGQLQGGFNVAIVAVIQNPDLGTPGDWVLIEQERHATGHDEIGLPRGFAEANLSGEANALKELREETGYIGTEAHLLGTTYIDTGLTDSKAHFYGVLVTGYAPQHRQTHEAIKRVFLTSKDAVWRGVQSGQILDSFTLQGLALYEKLWANL